jgi:hypothetical protein
VSLAESFASGREKMAVFCGIRAAPPRAGGDPRRFLLRLAGRKPSKSAGFSTSRRCGAQPSPAVPNHREILAGVGRFPGMTRCDRPSLRPATRGKRRNSRQSKFPRILEDFNGRCGRSREFVAMAIITACDILGMACAGAGARARTRAANPRARFEPARKSKGPAGCGRLVRARNKQALQPCRAARFARGSAHP